MEVLKKQFWRSGHKMEKRIQSCVTNMEVGIKLNQSLHVQIKFSYVVFLKYVQFYDALTIA